MPKGMFSKFAVFFLRADIEELEEYFDVVSTAIEEHANQTEANITSKAEAITDPDLKDQYYEAYQDRYDSVKFAYPRFFMYSFLVYVCTFIEDRLVEFCNRADVQKATGAKFNRRAKGGLVLNAKAYLASLGLNATDPIWKELERAFQIRNKITHGDGVLKDPNVIKEFRKLIRGRKGITLEKYQLAGRYRISIEKEYVVGQIDLAARFLKRLYGLV